MWQPTGPVVPPTLEGGAGANVSGIDIAFSEQLDASSVNAAGVTLTDLGTDGRIGGEDDVKLSVQSVIADNGSLQVGFGGTLPYGKYLLTLHPSTVSDVSGEQLAEAWTFEFTSYEADSDTVFWTSDEDGA